MKVEVGGQVVGGFDSNRGARDMHVFYFAVREHICVYPFGLNRLLLYSSQVCALGPSEGLV